MPIALLKGVAGSCHACLLLTTSNRFAMFCCACWRNAVCQIIGSHMFSGHNFHYGYRTFADDIAVRQAFPQQELVNLW